MSVPGVDITCDRCKYRGSTVVLFGHFKYSTSFGTISLPRILGWCSSCESLSPIEESNCGVRLESLARDLESTYDQIKEKKKSLRKNTAFFKRMLSFSQPHSKEIEELQQKAARISSELYSPAILEDYLNSSRKPCCLTCGSSAVQKAPRMPDELNDFNDSYRTKIPIGMKHPGCGGELLASTSELRLSLRLEDKIYNLAGERIA